MFVRIMRALEGFQAARVVSQMEPAQRAVIPLAGGRGGGATWTGTNRSPRDLLPSARWQVTTRE
eukprot:1771414-Lingulodinium_polyedra.AAC.1